MTHQNVESPAVYFVPHAYMENDDRSRLNRLCLAATVIEFKKASPAENRKMIILPCKAKKTPNSPTLNIEMSGQLYEIAPDLIERRSVLTVDESVDTWGELKSAMSRAAEGGIVVSAGARYHLSPRTERQARHLKKRYKVTHHTKSFEDVLHQADQELVDKMTREYLHQWDAGSPGKEKILKQEALKNLICAKTGIYGDLMLHIIAIHLSDPGRPENQMAQW